MKAYLLSVLVVLSFLSAKAQPAQVNTLPRGKYETVAKEKQHKWEKGDIILLEENKYMLSTSDEVGEYRFSVTAQRVFFTSGPLKSLFAKTSLNNNAPAIVLPVSENEQLGLKLPSEIWGYYKQ
ncbi:MAG TPA: hypothetical protein VFR58_17910 [Flavisolibacter sp.]|nr:hypothetical protein [Flavisolibacter sp.]